MKSYAEFAQRFEEMPEGEYDNWKKARLAYSGSIEGGQERMLNGLPERVFFHDGCICLMEDPITLGESIQEIGDHVYSISLGRADSSEKILAWVMHLGDKTWVTAEMLSLFVTIATSRAGIEVPLGKC